MSSVLSVITAGVLWGTGGLSGALFGRLADLHPMAVATLRLAGGGLSVMLLLALTGRLGALRAAGRPGATRVLAVGLLTASYQACYFVAVSLTSVGVATLVTLGSAPVLVLAAEAVGLRRLPGPRQLLAIGLAVVGLLLLVGLPGVGGRPGGAGGIFAGTLLALVSAAGFALLTLLGRRPVAGLDELTTIGAGFASGAVMLGVVTLPWTGLGFTPSVASAGLLCFLALVPTAVAYSLYFTGLRGVPASSAAVVAVLEPLTATVLGVLVLGEHLSLAGSVGAGLLCAATLTAGVGTRTGARTG
ncbi:EamA family transporter [Pseudonocardia eucalypti]|uniref:EamA family transporter n=1 Tax=Pseudonocardia eucalypti TaxID=648755 RepID=A0ABP9PH34_9PSEU|nr:DME family drug/metabolite transporter [Pseudonocardia eucalypti]